MVNEETLEIYFMYILNEELKETLELHSIVVKFESVDSM